MSEKVQAHAPVITKRFMKRAINIQVSLKDLLNENNLVYRLKKVQFQLPITKVKSSHILQNDACVLAFRIDDNNRIDTFKYPFAYGKYNRKRKQVVFKGTTSALEMLVSNLWREGVENLKLALIVSKKTEHCYDFRNIRPYHFTIPSLRYVSTDICCSFSFLMPHLK